MQPIVFMTGYYGSGKTEIVLELAIRDHYDMVIDLDIINPYFRSREAHRALAEAHIQLISSDHDQPTYADMPYVSGRMYAPFLETGVKAIYDLGGNDLGAKLLRQFEMFDQEIELLLVVNLFRPETSDTEKIIQLIHAIEGSSGRKVTGLINNTNLLKETTAEDILAGQEVLREVSHRMKLPIRYTVVERHVPVEGIAWDGDLLRLQLRLRKSWY